MTTIFLSYAFPPQEAPRAVQVARLAQYSTSPILVFCAGMPGIASVLRPGVEVMRFHDASQRWWRLVKSFVYSPDSERPWADRLASTILARKLASRDDVLVTFGQPMSDHLAGLALKRQIGLAWIAHFSDPWTDNPYLLPLTRLRQRRMERQVAAVADRLLFTSAETLDLVMRKYPAAWRAKADVLPHAYDPGLDHVTAPPRERPGILMLRHLGNFYGPRNPLMLVQALAYLHRTQPELLKNVRIELVGRWVGHERWSAAGSGLPSELFRVRPSIPYEDSLREMRGADALLIVDAPFAHNVFFPSKLVDYLWARRPILALTPPGTTADIVRAAGGLVASPEAPESIAVGLAELLTRLRAGTIGPPSEDVVSRYDAREVAARFDSLVRDVQSRTGEAAAVDVVRA